MKHPTQMLFSRRCNDRRPCDRCRAARPEACVDPAEATNAAAAAPADLPDAAAAAARAREEEASALLWRSFARTASAARAEGIGTSADASSGGAALEAQTATLAGASPLSSADRNKDVLQGNAATAAAAAAFTATVRSPVQEWASDCPVEAAPASAATFESLYAQRTDGEYHRGGDGGGAALWTFGEFGGCAPPPPPIAKSGLSAAAGQTPWAAAAALEATDIITAPLTWRIEAEYSRPEFLQRPQVRTCGGVWAGRRENWKVGEMER